MNAPNLFVFLGDFFFSPPSDNDLLCVFSSEHRDQATRSLRGVMRVGLVAKGLLLKGDLDLELVLLCKEKPTIMLLKKVSENLLAQLKVSARFSSFNALNNSISISLETDRYWVFNFILISLSESRKKKQSGCMPNSFECNI